MIYIKYHLHKDGSPIWDIVDNELEANKRIDELKVKGYIGLCPRGLIRPPLIVFFAGAKIYAVPHGFPAFFGEFYDSLRCLA